MSLGAQLLLDRTDDSNEPLYVLADRQAIRSASSSPEFVDSRSRCGRRQAPRPRRRAAWVTLVPDPDRAAVTVAAEVP